MIAVLVMLPQGGVRGEGRPPDEQEGTSSLDDDDELLLPWRLVGGRSWQIVSDLREKTDRTDAVERNRGRCPPGSIDVRGRMKLDPSPAIYARAAIERMELGACTDWLQRGYPFRCNVFDAVKWHRIASKLKTRAMHFCIDRFEYPSILKGGYWGPGADGCRPSTRAHFHGFSFYQLGFRCCADVPCALAAARRPAGAHAKPSTACVVR